MPGKTTASICAVVLVQDRPEYLRASLSSIDQACEAASRWRISVTVHVVCGARDEETPRILATRGLPFRLWRCDEGFEDPSRGLLEAARSDRSTYISILHAGDLICRSWFTLCARAMEKRFGMVFHPKANIFFGSAPTPPKILTRPDQSSPNYVPAGLYWRDYWSPNLFMRREGFLRVPRRKPRSGFGQYGWLWNCEAIRIGLVHRAIPRTVHFLREGSRHAEALIRPEDALPAEPSPLFDTGASAPTTEGSPLPPSLSADGWLLSEWQGVQSIEPEIFPSPSMLSALKTVALPSGELTNTYCRFREALGTVDYLFVMHQLRKGGAELEAALQMQTIRKADPVARIAVILTGIADAEWIGRLPDDVRVLPLGREMARFHSHAEVIEVLSKLMFQARARVIHVKHSWHAWEVYSRWGQALSQLSKLYGSFYCIDYNSEGGPFSYAHSYLRPSMKHIEAVFCDNQAMARHLAEVCGFARTFVLRYPTSVPFRKRSAARPCGAPLRLLWASRISPQKDVGLLFELAKQMLRDEFHMYGESSDDASEWLYERLSASGNVIFHGGFDGLDSIDTASFDALVYTSKWDGLPNILLEAGALCLPVVASAVGGIPELIDNGTGYLCGSEAQFLEALEAIRADPKESARRAANLQKVIRERHSLAQFEKALASVPGYLSSARGKTAPAPRRSRVDHALLSRSEATSP